MPYYIRPTPPDQYFPTAKSKSYLGEVGNGWLIKYTFFYLKIYPSETQKDRLEIYQYRYGEESPYRVEVIKSEALEEWAQQFNSCS